MDVHKFGGALLLPCCIRCTILQLLIIISKWLKAMKSMIIMKLEIVDCRWLGDLAVPVHLSVMMNQHWFAARFLGKLFSADPDTLAKEALRRESVEVADACGQRLSTSTTLSAYHTCSCGDSDLASQSSGTCSCSSSYDSDDEQTTQEGEYKLVTCEHKITAQHSYAYLNLLDTVHSWGYCNIMGVYLAF